MLIAGINGSPNKQGNTMHLLEQIEQRIKSMGHEFTIINAADAVLACKNPFCTACSTPCSGMCFKETELEKAYEIMTKADGWIVGSPVYFGTVSAQLKAFFDKTRGLRSSKVWINKVGAGVTVGASKYGGQETTIRAIHDILMVHGIIIVGDGHADKDAGHHGVCAQKPSNSDTFALERSEVLAKRVVDVCEATKSLRQIHV